MKNLNVIAEQLFNHIRGRFPSVEIGDAEGNVTNEPSLARFFDFAFESNGNELGNVSVTLDEKDGVVVMFNSDVTEGEDYLKRNWYSFLKDIRVFAKKRLMNFEVRDINRSNLTKRDYKFLAANRSGEQTMAESKMYGTNKTSYQKVGNARLAIKHSAPINTEDTKSRTKNIASIFVESPSGERFKYPFKHLSGARAMAMHVSEGGNAYDDFGKHISNMSEELSKLRKFKQYMNRSGVMAESLAGYMDIVKERMTTIQKTISGLQKESFYKKTVESFVPQNAKDVPDEVAENWIDQLTIKQFNEELKDVFPYIYNLVSESTLAKNITFEDIMSEETVGGDVVHVVRQGDTVYGLARTLGINVDDIIEVNGLNDNGNIQIGERILLPGVSQQQYDQAMSGKKDMSNPANRAVTEPTGDDFQFNPNAGHRDQPSHPENRGLSDSIDHAIDKLMGQFAESDHTGIQDMVDEKPQTPLGEFILSYFDRSTGQFPKGPTAVLTMVEKEYGEQYVRPASKFIERIDSKVAEVMGYREADLDENEPQQAPIQVVGQPRDIRGVDRYRAVKVSINNGQPQTALMNPQTGELYVRSGRGFDIWDPGQGANMTPRHFPQGAGNMRDFEDSFDRAVAAMGESQELDRISALAGLR